MGLPETPDEALRFLGSLASSGVRLGLDRVREALRLLKNPERDFPALHVAGTNGKGSTCAFAAACLRAQGYRVGLYTSPHLLRVNERIEVCGEPIDDRVLGERVLEVLERFPRAAKEPGHLTYFEFGTLVALWHFARERVDVAVLETGLGGRLDATTAASPVVCAITPVSFDHMDYLGHTLAAIATEKAGILKPGVPAVVARQPPDVMAVLDRAARDQGAPLRIEGEDFAMRPEYGEAGPLYAYRGMGTTLRRLRLGLRGDHQVQNAAVAVASLELLMERGFPVSEVNVRRGLLSTRWPGRLEEIDREPTVVVDGAHNPAGMEALVRSMGSLYPGRGIHAVFGVLGDKDHRPMLRQLMPICRSAHLTPLPSPRSLPPERYLADAKELCPAVQAYGSTVEALAAARRLAAGTDDLVLATGSLFLVGEVKGILEC